MVISCMLLYGAPLVILLVGLHRLRNAKRNSFFLINSLDRQYNALITGSEPDISTLYKQILTRLDEIIKLKIAMPDELKSQIVVLLQHLSAYPRVNPKSKYSQSEYEEIIKAFTAHHQETITFGAACLAELDALVKPEGSFNLDVLA